MNFLRAVPTARKLEASFNGNNDFMATKKTPLGDDDDLAMPGGDADFDDAVGSLRGVLKNDAEGTLPDFGGGFGANPGGGRASSGFSGGYTSSQPLGSAMTSNLDLIMDIPIDVQIVLGSSRMHVSGLMNLEEGAIIPLDKKIGEPVEIMVNGRRIARGEITVLENDDTRFGVKLIEVMSVKIP